MTAPTQPDRTPFAAGLTAAQKKLFRELQDLFDHRNSSLAWYHRAGTKLNELLASSDKRERGWVQELANAIGQSTSNLTKLRKFAADFTEQDAHRLDQRGCNWGKVTAVLHAGTAADRQKPARCKKLRQELLAQSVDWNLAELKAEIKKRYGADHAGGRPLRTPQSCEARLRRLDALGCHWLRYCREVWSSAGESDGEQTAGLKSSDKAALAELLPQVEQTVRAMRQALDGVDRSLAALERKLKH